jgi:hypothetical protein
MKILNWFKTKKHSPPCICYFKDDMKNPEDCLIHTLIHKQGRYKKGCPYCNYDDVKYQSEVKLKN